MFRDIARGLRSWRRTPGSALLMILALGLSGGAFLTLVSLSNALLWRELSIPHPEELVGVTGIGRNTASWVNVAVPASLAAELDSAGDAIGELAGSHRLELLAVIDDASQRLVIEGVSAGYFATLGVRPLLGRVIDSSDVGRASPVATISFHAWQRRFNADPDVIGRTFRLRGGLITVIGVAPPAFTGLQVGMPADVWIPTTLVPALLDQPPALTFFDALVGRLRPNATLEGARAALEARWPAAREAAAAVVAPALPGLRDYVLDLAPRIQSAARGFSPYGGFYRSALLWLLVTCAMAVLISCANLSGLLLARWSTREADLAVQAALGASRERLVLQIFGESLALSAVAVVLSLPIALWSAQALTRLIWNQPVVPPLDVSPDVRVLALMAAVIVIVASCMSLLPVWRVWSAPLAPRLGGRGSANRGVTRWGRRVAAAQVALSAPLIVAAWMIAAHLHHLAGVNTGFRPDEVIAVRLTDRNTPTPIHDPAAYLRNLAETADGLPGVSSAALASSEPVQIGGPRRRRVADADGDRTASAFVEPVSPRYLATLGMTLVTGRDFTWADIEGTPEVAVMSQRLAGALFGNEHPIGRRVRLADKSHRTLEVVGVVADANLAEPHQADQRFLFTPYLQQSRALLDLQQPVILLNSALPVPVVLASLQRAIATPGHHDVLDGRSLRDGISAVLVRERVMRLGAMYFAALATLLVFIGLLAQLSFDVTRRIPEIGVRVALGASPRDVRLLVIRQALGAALAGLAIGVPLAFVCGRLTVRFLSLLAPSGAAAIASAVALILVTTVLAVLIPLRRVNALNPSDALRQE